MTPTCPRCGRPALPIIYGLADAEMFAASDRGEIVRGGCVMRPDSPTWACEDEECDEQWQEGELRFEGVAGMFGPSLS
jgi:hypothetical protein